MEYKALKELQIILKASDEEKIVIEKQTVVSFIDEILIMRRHNAAKIRQNFANKNKKNM